MAAHRYWRLKLNERSPNVLYVLLAEVKMYLRGTTTNAIGSGVASASGSTGTAGNAADGSLATYWEFYHGGVMPQWWQYDFGAGNAKDIGRIDISSYSNWANELPVDFEIQWSDDGGTFTTVYRAQRLFWSVNQTFSFPVPDTGDAKYYAYRLSVTANNGGTFGSIAELALRSASGGTNLALGKVPIDTTNDGTNRAANAFDGSLTTAWQTTAAAGGTGAGAVGVIFSDAPTIVEMAISIRSNVNETVQAPKDFALQGTTNGVTWFTVKSWTGQTGWAQGETRTFAVDAAPVLIARPQVFVCT